MRHQNKGWERTRKPTFLSCSSGGFSSCWMSNLSRRAIRNRTSRVQRQNDSAVLSYLLVVVRLRYFIRTQRISCALSQPKVIKKLDFWKLKQNSKKRLWWFTTFPWLTVQYRTGKSTSGRKLRSNRWKDAERRKIEPKPFLCESLSTGLKCLSTKLYTAYVWFILRDGKQPYYVKLS